VAEISEEMVVCGFRIKLPLRRLGSGDMYLSHYHLQHMPFQISSDPRFFLARREAQGSPGVLKYGFSTTRGFCFLTGDVGTGKTTLINALVNSLDPNTFVINVTDPRLDKLDFFKLVAALTRVGGQSEDQI